MTTITKCCDERKYRRLQQHFISVCSKDKTKQTSRIFDNTLLDIAKENSDLFSVLTEVAKKIVLFENI
jgi:type I restriction enzyme M protein